MAIKALSETTVHLLGSTQVLTTPTSLVKELIDNAIDARATHIDILISQNTIDKIEVRDNGHGIQPDDLESLGKRGHTSKLTAFEELRTLGGITLGFRGEALASAVQLGQVSVTTRIDGEPVATCVKLKSSGGVESQTRASHPIGTTVSVKDFMSKLPVRKQTALKEAPKTLTKIKDLIQTYALARCSVKFSLKIVKGGKGAWSFAPRPHDGIKEAVSQVIGRDAATQCIESSLLFPLEGDMGSAEDNTSEHDATTLDSHRMQARYRLEAFIPRPDADPTKIGSGQYISIDSRPVSHEKGTMKKLVTTFKKYLRGAISENTPEKLKNPFMRLNISCPKASYDPNVEPAKDDVLFGDETIILDAAEKLFQNVYGECKIAPVFAKSATKGNVGGFDVLLAKKPNHPPPMEAQILESLSSMPREALSTSTTESTDVAEPRPSSSRRRLIIESDESLDFSTFDAEKENGGTHLPENPELGLELSTGFVEHPDNTQPAGPVKIGSIASHSSIHTDEMHPGDSADLNPWLIAKMTAHVKPRGGQDTTEVSSRATEIISSVNSVGPLLESDPGYDLGSPRHVTRSEEWHRVARESRSADSTSSLMSPEPLEHGATRANPWLALNQPVQSREDSSFDDYRPQRRARADGFISAKTFAEQPPMSPPATLPLAAQRSRENPRPRGVNKGINKPFSSPFRRSEPSHSSDRFVQTRLSLPDQAFNVQREPRRGQAREQSPEEVPEPQNADLEWAMDFEQRKENLQRRRREEIRAMREHFDQPVASQASPRPSPHKNRYNAALAALEPQDEMLIVESPVQEKKTFNTSLPDDDPRGYYMKRQKSIMSGGENGGPRKLKRAQTMRLPLEAIADELQVHHLVQEVQTDVGSVENIMKEVGKQDAYIRHGITLAGLEMPAAGRRAVGEKLRDVVGAWLNGKGEKCEVEFSFGELGSLSGA